jgi:hypothetical protein
MASTQPFEFWFTSSSMTIKLLESPISEKFGCQVRGFANNTAVFWAEVEDIYSLQNLTGVIA